MYNYSATFACYNNVAYTQKCIESLRRSNFDLSRLVIVDNRSTDDTADYLHALNGPQLIRNKQNLGCGTAWNQGILAQQAEWTVIMNNDILVSHDWIENLIAQTIEAGLLVSSPAMMEGPDDYDWATRLPSLEDMLQVYHRPQAAHAVCLLVHESVWQKVGYFRATPKLLGFEDTLFFFDCFRNNVPHAAMGRSWIHHFGSVTVKALKAELGIKKRSGGLGDRNNKNLLDQGIVMRKWRKLLRQRHLKACRTAELRRFGVTVHGVREGGEVRWL
jgi:glycosyltransferase involved in cell wall biosynthesis